MGVNNGKYQRIKTVYLHFKNKEDILDYIFMNEFNKRLKFIEGIKDNNISSLQKIGSFLMFHISYLQEPWHINYR
ncbi:MAG: hypothetical protein APF77_05835 [Clostridia bacterium BRH_c25]|nr:MAG: hypothetical protein APF77_05835 [Clostridia bacterium BRH_c25]